MLFNQFYQLKIAIIVTRLQCNNLIFLGVPASSSVVLSNLVYVVIPNSFRKKRNTIVNGIDVTALNNKVIF
jgi:hypothetical protein